jgi:hypothetical protein
MQTLDFKQSPPEVQELFMGHVAATEKLMFEQAAENPLFGDRLGQLRQFPMLYTPKPVNEPIPQPPMEEEMEQTESTDNMPLNEPTEAEMLA